MKFNANQNKTNKIKTKKHFRRNQKHGLVLDLAKIKTKINKEYSHE